MKNIKIDEYTYVLDIDICVLMELINYTPKFNVNELNCQESKIQLENFLNILIGNDMVDEQDRELLINLLEESRYMPAQRRRGWLLTLFPGLFFV